MPVDERLEQEINRRVNTLLNPTLAIRQSTTYGVFRHTCDHSDHIGLTPAEYCGACGDMRQVERVCDAYLTWRADGTVILHGEGYADASK